MNPLPHRRTKSTAEEVERLLDKVEVHRRTGGGGTLLTEPVIVARGEHEGRLELLDQDGRQLGFAERRTHSPMTSVTRMASAC